MTATAKKPLILHIGTGKTGTTAIQETFWKNRAALARAGVAYPAVGAISSAHHLITPRIPPFLKDRPDWNFLTPAEWAPVVAALPEDRVFMSSELISSANPDQIAAFCAALEPFVDLHVCIYLRRQDDMIAASWSQSVKAGTLHRPLHKILKNMMLRSDHLNRITPWENALGRDRLIIRPYERSQFHQGDLIRDILLRALGMSDLPPGFVHDPAATANARLSIAATEFKRLLNGLLPDPQFLRQFIAPLHDCPPDPKGAHMLGRADRAHVIAHFADSNARIARDYLDRPEGDLFHDPLPADAPLAPPVTDAAALHTVIATLSRKVPHLVHKLEMALAADHSHDPVAAEAARRLRDAMEAVPSRAIPDPVKSGNLTAAAKTPPVTAAPPVTAGRPAPAQSGLSGLLRRLWPGADG